MRIPELLPPGKVLLNGLDRGELTVTGNGHLLHAMECSREYAIETKVLFYDGAMMIENCPEYFCVAWIDGESREFCVALWRRFDENHKRFE